MNANDSPDTSAQPGKDEPTRPGRDARKSAQHDRSTDRTKSDPYRYEVREVAGK